MIAAYDKVVLDGELSLNLAFDGDMDLSVPLDGEMGLFTTIVQADYPFYTGPTEITPTEDTQILPTADTIVLENITVNPIPTNYGLITWNGSVITVS